MKIIKEDERANGKKGIIVEVKQSNMKEMSTHSLKPMIVEGQILQKKK